MVPQQKSLKRQMSLGMPRMNEVRTQQGADFSLSLKTLPEAADFKTHFYCLHRHLIPRESSGG